MKFCLTLEKDIKLSAASEQVEAINMSHLFPSERPARAGDRPGGRVGDGPAVLCAGPL